MIDFLKQFEHENGQDYFPWDYVDCYDDECCCIGYHDDTGRADKARRALNELPWNDFFAAEQNRLKGAGFKNTPQVFPSEEIISIKYVNHFDPKIVAIFKLNVVTGVYKLKVQSVDGWGSKIMISWDKFLETDRKLLQSAKYWLGLEKKAAKVPALVARVKKLEQENAALRLAPGGPDYLAAKEHFEQLAAPK